MHQPWASLVVAGIKKHEGRSWYTSHRGRLWIAATAKPVDPNEVKVLENFYRKYYNGMSIFIFNEKIVVPKIQFNFLLYTKMTPLNSQRLIQLPVFWAVF